MDRLFEVTRDISYVLIEALVFIFLPYLIFPELEKILLFFCVIQNLLKISRPSGFFSKHQDDKNIDKDRDGERQPQPKVGHHHPGKHGL